MPPIPSNIPQQLLPVVADVGFRLDAASHVRMPSGRLGVFTNGTADGGMEVHDRVVTSALAALPVQVAIWLAMFADPGVDPVVWAWSISLNVIKFPSGDLVSHGKTAYSVTTWTASQKPIFHFLVDDPVTLNRFMWPADMLDVGDVFNLSLTTQITNPLDNYASFRWWSASVWYYFAAQTFLSA